jgi:hypothetical protein
MTPCRLVDRFRAYVEGENISIPDGSRNKTDCGKKKKAETKYGVIVAYRGRFPRSRIKKIVYVKPGRFQCPRGVKRSSDARCGLGLRVPIPPRGTWLLVSYECCVLPGTGLCDGLIPCSD